MYNLEKISMNTLMKWLRMDMIYKYPQEKLVININDQKCYIASSLASLSYVVREFPYFSTFEKYFRENGYDAYVCTKNGNNIVYPFNEVFLINARNVIQLAEGGGYAFSPIYDARDFWINGPRKVFEKRRVACFAPLQGKRLLPLLK